MKSIESSELLSGYMKNPEHIVTTKLQDNKEKNPVARRERLHESSTDLRKINPIKMEGIMKKPEHKVTTNLQKIKEGNPVARQKLHETHKIQENKISDKDTNVKQERYIPEIKIARLRCRERRVEDLYKEKNPVGEGDDPINITEEDREVHNANVNNDKSEDIYKEKNA